MAGRRIFRQHDLQPPGVQILHDFPEGFQRQPLPRQAPLAQHLAIVGIHGPGHPEGLGSFRGLEGPAELLRAGKAQQQAVVLQQIGGLVGVAMAQEIARGGDDEAPVGRELAGDGVGIAELGDADGEVHAVLDQVHELIRQMQADLDVGIALDEGGDTGRHMHPPEGRRHGDANGPAGIVCALGDAALGLLQLVQDRHAVLVEQGTLLGRLHTPGGAVQQARAHASLEAGDAVADHRHRHAHVAPGGGQAAKLHHPHEDRDVLGIRHPRPIIYESLKMYLFIA